MASKDLLATQKDLEKLELMCTPGFHRSEILVAEALHNLDRGFERAACDYCGCSLDHTRPAYVMHLLTLRFAIGCEDCIRLRAVIVNYPYALFADFRRFLLSQFPAGSWRPGLDDLNQRFRRVIITDHMQVSDSDLLPMLRHVALKEGFSETEWQAYLSELPAAEA